MGSGSMITKLIGNHFQCSALLKLHDILSLISGGEPARRRGFNEVEHEGFTDPRYQAVLTNDFFFVNYKTASQAIFEAIFQDVFVPPLYFKSAT